MPDAWLERLGEIARHQLVALNPACSDGDIRRAEADLGTAVPAQLAEFLRASNGLSDLSSRFPYGWDLTTIVSENSRAWSDAVTPLDRDLLAFGADGAGGWFCLSLDPREQQGFHWTWIEGRAVPVADNLSAFWPSWLSGDLKI